MCVEVILNRPDRKGCLTRRDLSRGLKEVREWDVALWGKSLVETGPWWLGLGHGDGTGVRREDQSARECGGRQSMQDIPVYVFLKLRFYYFKKWEEKGHREIKICTYLIKCLRNVIFNWFSVISQWLYHYIYINTCLNHKKIK